MSLLDDVSIVVTPNGYKAGTLYGVLPTATEGSDLVTNGGFDTDSDWNGSGSNGWTISGGKASNDGESGSNNLSQSGILLVNKQYKIDITVSNYVSGNVQVSAGAGPRDTMTANGTYTFYQTCTPSTTFYIIANSFDGSVDNVSVKEWTASDMDVTRATAATRVDEDGLVNYAEILGGEEIDNGGFSTNLDYWSTSSWWVWNALGAYHPSTSLHKPLYQQCCVIGKTYLITFDLNCVGSSLAKFSIGSSAGSTTQVIATSLTSGSYSYYVTAAAEYIVFNRQNTAEYYVNNVSVKEVTRDNVPRIDYTGGGCPHILAEPQRTNLLTYSSDFSNAYWTKSGATVESGFTSPDGTDNAFKLVEDTSTGTHYVESVGTSTAQDYSRTIYAKAGERDIIQITQNGVFSSCYANFNLTTGTITASAFCTAKIELLSNGWYKCTISATFYARASAISIFNIRTQIDPLADRATTRTGDGTSGVYIYGAQLEVGSYPTSYIPTSGSTVTRNQDIFTRDGISSLINSAEGVLFLEMSRQDGNSISTVISINNGTSSNMVSLYYFNNGIAFDIYSGSPILSGNITGVNTSIFNKIALKYKSGDVALWVNGVEVVTSANAISLTGLNKISFDYGNGSFPFYGKVKQLQVYDTALTDMQLIQLTGTAGTDFYESYAEMAEALTYTIQ